MCILVHIHCGCADLSHGGIREQHVCAMVPRLEHDRKVLHDSVKESQKRMVYLL